VFTFFTKRAGGRLTFFPFFYNDTNGSDSFYRSDFMEDVPDTNRLTPTALHFKCKAVGVAPLEAS